MSIDNVFIVEQSNQGWIIEHLMRDIASELRLRNIDVQIGAIDQYKGQQVLFNSRYDNAYFRSDAKVNSVFVTHIDDIVKEIDAKIRLKKYNSLICMSKDDEEYLCALGLDADSVIGINLPLRQSVLEPMKLSLFTACYPDGRKNENWLYEYFQTRPANIKQCILQFLGQDWESFLFELKSLNCNFEYYRYGRDLPNEYNRYKSILKESTYLLYMGFDGGAMCAYDALCAGVPSLLPNVGYHRGLEINSTLFDDKVSFFKCLDAIFDKHNSTEELINSRSVEVYVNKLIGHWSDLLNENKNFKDEIQADKKLEILRIHRNQYHRITGIRLKVSASKILKLIKGFFNA